MSRNCKYCNQPIPEGRVEALPNIQTCLPCKQEHEGEQRIMGHMVYNHKTGGEIQVVTPQQFDDLQRLNRRGYKRSR